MSLYCRRRNTDSQIGFMFTEVEHDDGFSITHCPRGLGPNVFQLPFGKNKTKQNKPKLLPQKSPK